MSDRLIVVAQVDETDIAQVQLKQPARIVLDAYPDQSLDGRVDLIAFDAKTVNNVTTYAVEVIPHKVPHFMRSGMTDNVSFRVANRKDVLWVTEDLMIHPGVDLYHVFFTKFSAYSKQMTIVQPELWATEVELLDEFRYIADVSQIAGTVLHVVDASDRDREAANTGTGGADPDTQWVTDQRGRGATAGYDFGAMRSLEEGSAFLAQATGGSLFGSSRNFDDYFERLGEMLDSYYFIGYRRPGPPDGKVHDYSVRLTRNDLRVRTHERIPNPTADQRLADIAVSRLMINEGPNPLGLEVSLGPSEPAEGDRYIQEIRLTI